MLLTSAAVLAFAFAALPAFASAATPELDFTGGATEPTASVTFGETKLTDVNGSTTICTGPNHAIIVYRPKTTGHVRILWTNCHSESGIGCQNGASGEIATGELEFHLVYIKGFTKTPGILITSPIFEFKCSIITVKIKGNGFIGHIGNTCGSKSKSLSLNFTSSAKGVQTYQEFEGSTEKWHLISKTGSGAEEEASEEMGLAPELEGGVESELTCP